MNQKINAWLEEMTLEEKTGLCSGADLWHTKEVKRLGIERLTITDGPHGVRLAETGIMSQLVNLALTGTEGMENTMKKATCFPTASALAASWDPVLVEHVGKAIGMEAANMGVHMILAPGVNIIRTPLGGRNFEYYSEDPMLSAAMGGAMVQGIQSQGVGAVLKHFACNNTEYRRMTVDVQVDEKTLHEFYLRAFRIVIKRFHPAAVMSAYNRLNGAPCSESAYLLKDVLRDMWGYEGLTISDWAAVYDRVKAMQAGLDLEMPGFAMHDEALADAVRSGVLDEAEIDNAVRRLLTCGDRYGKDRMKGVRGSNHHGLARHAAAQSMVLLKNEHGILPLDKARPVSIVCVGEGWVEPTIQGNGSSRVRAAEVDQPLVALKEALHLKSVIAYAGSAGSLQPKTLDAADYILIAATPHPDHDLEGRDRTQMDLPEKVLADFSLMSAYGDKTVVCLMTSGPVSTQGWADHFAGLLHVGLGGESVGGALADILTGVVNPSGRLAVSWPEKIEHSSAYLHFPGVGDRLIYGERQFVGYRHAITAGVRSRYPFGYGLSYTEFEIVDVSSEDRDAGSESQLRYCVTVRNTGARPGKTVVQAYVRRSGNPGRRPFRELAGFSKVTLQPGELKQVALVIHTEVFERYNPRTGRMEPEQGLVYIDFGQSCDSAEMTLTHEVDGDGKDTGYLSKYSYLSDWLADELGRETLIEALRPFLPFEDFPMDHPLVGLFLEMPLIKIVNYSGGLVSEAYLDHLELTLLKKRDQG